MFARWRFPDHLVREIMIVYPCVGINVSRGIDLSVSMLTELYEVIFTDPRNHDDGRK